MNWAYSEPALTLLAPPIASSSPEHSSRILGSSALTADRRECRQDDPARYRVERRVRRDGRRHPDRRGRRVLIGTTVTEHDRATGEVARCPSRRPRRPRGSRGTNRRRSDRCALPGSAARRSSQIGIGVGNPLRIGVVPVSREVFDGWLDRSSLVLDEDRVLGAVRLSQSGQLDGVVAERAVADHDSAAQVVEAKDVGCYRETATLTLTDIRVNPYLHDPSFVVIEETLLLGNGSQLPGNHSSAEGARSPAHVRREGRRDQTVGLVGDLKLTYREPEVAPEVGYPRTFTCERPGDAGHRASGRASWRSLRTPGWAPHQVTARAVART